MQLARHSEDNVEMCGRQDTLLTSPYPALLCESLALRAVPIATRVVRGSGIATSIADIQVATERSCPACCYGREGATLFGSTHCVGRKPMTVTAGDLADVMSWSMLAPLMGRRHVYSAGSSSSRLTAWLINCVETRT